MIHGRSAPAYFYSPQLCGGGKLARKPQRAHDERRVNAFIGQRRMPDRIEARGNIPRILIPRTIERISKESTEANLNTMQIPTITP